MQKLPMHSPNLTQENMARIRELFPNCVTEARGEDGKVKLAVDFDLLRQELSESIVEGPQERYRLDWPGKREALLAANAPIAKTLRPDRDESVDFDTTKNLYIEGDNLDALKLLQETYLGKVKMIYIDPPYNTGNDFIYEDDFAENTDEFLRRSNQKDENGNRLVANTESNGRFHSDWLSMMYPRLKLARNLLRDDGVIFISIDDGEVANLRRVCDEVFGEGNFVGVYLKQSKVGGGSDTKHIVKEHEYSICYSKQIQILSEMYIDHNKEYLNRYNEEDENGKYFWDTFARPGLKNPIIYDIIAPDGTVIKNGWIRSKERFNDEYNKGIIRIIKKTNNEWSVQFKQYLNIEGKKPRSMTMDFGGTIEGKNELFELFKKDKMFSYPKSVYFIRQLIKTLTETKSDIILDFFSGSATTAHAVMQLNAEDGGNRQFIMVQLPEACAEKSEAAKAGYKTIAEIGKERIRRAGKKIFEAQQITNQQGNLLQEVSKPLDIGFRVLKVDSSNMADVYYTPDMLNQQQLSLLTDNIKLGRTSEDLLFQVLLDWGVDLTLPIRKDTIQGKTVFFVDENALVACFDIGLTEELVKELTRVKPCVWFSAILALPQMPSKSTPPKFLSSCLQVQRLRPYE